MFCPNCHNKIVIIKLPVQLNSVQNDLEKTEILSFNENDLKVGGSVSEPVMPTMVTPTYIAPEPTVASPAYQQAQPTNPKE